MPISPDGIALYSKDSAASHLLFKSSGIWTDSHASRNATSDSGLPGISTRGARTFGLSDHLLAARDNSTLRFGVAAPIRNGNEKLASRLESHDLSSV
jgi:hypothetical protein